MPLPWRRPAFALQPLRVLSTGHIAISPCEIGFFDHENGIVDVAENLTLLRRAGFDIQFVEPSQTIIQRGKTTRVNVMPRFRVLIPPEAIAGLSIEAPTRVKELAFFRNGLLVIFSRGIRYSTPLLYPYTLERARELLALGCPQGLVLTEPLRSHVLGA
ncbi:hypothetical protein HN358_00360 [Candidatus Uhrbacteria bacterium]|jgi:hypothetical protein|nr:hypothetical protein [Candidatus Uhrbacteria bacterium]MBT7717706.1 hypothetical protein [Candidatus Uhrbacteria bacterium]